MEFLIGIIIVIVGVVGIIAISSIIKGWVLTKLWAWFLVPYFELPQIPISLAIGISLVVGFLTSQPFVSRISNERTLNQKLIDAAITMSYPFIALLMGWIVKGFLPPVQ